MNDGRIPPQAVEVEETVLGSMIMEPDVIDVVLDVLNDSDFYKPAHRHVFHAITDLYQSDCAVDLLTVEEWLKDELVLDSAGGVDYLNDLTRSGSGANIEYYCQIIKEKSIKREIILECTGLIKDAYDSTTDVYAVADRMAEKSSEIGITSIQKHSLTPSEIQERDKNTPKAEKLFLGYSDMDHGIYGNSFKRGQNILTIADSGHGKTQWAFFKAECLLNQGRVVHWFQLEGYDSETAEYIMALTKNYDNLLICDSLHDIEDIKREARRINRDHGTDMAVFDYVQNIETKQNISKTEQVEYISRSITKLAKELNCVCCPLSQVTIDQKRSGWKQEPSYNDVRWSKQLKQDASIIVSVFRPSRIEDLVIDGESVKNWKGNPVPYDSVFIKQAKVRHGKQSWKRLHMIHTDKGLKPFSPKPF